MFEKKNHVVHTTRLPTNGIPRQERKEAEILAVIKAAVEYVILKA